MKAYTPLFRLLEKLIDLGVNLLAAFFGYIVTLKYTATISDESFNLAQARVGGLISAAILIAFLSLICYSYAGVYRPMRSEQTTFYVGRLLTVNFTILCLYIVYAAIALSGYAYYFFWAMTTFCISTVLLVAKKSVIIWVIRRVRESKRNIKNVLLLTDSQEMAEEYLREIHLNPGFGYNVIGYVGNIPVGELEHLGMTSELDAVLRRFQPDEVVMAFETVRRETMIKFVSICEDNCVKVLAVPAICGIFRSQRQLKQLGMLPMIDIRSTPLDHPASRFLKRATDIVLSAIFLVLSAPVMLFAAIGVRISSPGPILFRQERVGRGNRVFTIYKFRSMYVNDAETFGWSTDNDPRVTRFGSFMRRHFIDELPQLWCVLKGDMSLVGPRPEMTHFVEKFRKKVPLYMLKHSVRPGLTGLAQIHGLRGDTSIERRIEEDIYYIEHWTWFSDLKIIFLTPFKTIVRRSNTAPKDKKEQKKK